MGLFVRHGRKKARISVRVLPFVCQGCTVGQGPSYIARI